MALRSAAMPGNHDIGKHPPTPHRLRRLLLCVGVLVLCCSATALAFAAKRIVIAQAASLDLVRPALRAEHAQPLGGAARHHARRLAAARLLRCLIANADQPARSARRRDLADISVSGSRSGHHSGRLKAYSQGDGASFVSSKPFEAGETVTVRGRLKVAGKAQPFAYHFVVAVPDNLRYVPSEHAPADPAETQHFHSRPELEPPELVITASSTARPRRETCSPLPTPARARTAR